MQIYQINNKNILNIFIGVLNNLSEKEKDVIEKRIGLKGKRETLQSIGNSFFPNITRERVRQIECSGIKKIGKIIKSTELCEIQEYAKKILIMHGGLLSKDKIINAIISNFNFDSNLNNNLIEIIIQSDFDIIKSKFQLGIKSHFYLPDINKKLINLIHKDAISILKKRNDVMDKIALYELIKVNYSDLNLKNVFIDSVLDLYDDIVFGENNLIGLTKWRILNPKTLKDKALYIFRKEKVPMHFVDVANKITQVMGKKVKINTIHNELIRNPEFVLIGRGIYALRDWGIYKPGTVLDVIIDIMKKSGKPMSTNEIIAKVLKVRKVSKNTIYINLQNKNVIQRVGRGYFALKN